MKIRIADNQSEQLTFAAPYHDGVCEIEVGRNARLSVNESIDSAHGVMRIVLREGSRVDCRFAAVGGESSSVEYVVELCGEQAEFEMNGFFMAAAGEQTVVKSTVRHLSPACHSCQMIKGIAGSTGKGDFEGLVYVAPHAQHTEAYQQSRNIVFGSKARIQTKPQLEIYADDVKCSHGATVGQNDQQAVYYMRQRGLSEQDARRLQVEGFVNDIIEGFFDRELAERIMAEAQTTIGKLTTDN